MPQFGYAQSQNDKETSFLDDLDKVADHMGYVGLITAGASAVGAGLGALIGFGIAGPPGAAAGMTAGRWVGGIIGGGVGETMYQRGWYDTGDHAWMSGRNGTMPADTQVTFKSWADDSTDSGTFSYMIGGKGGVLVQYYVNEGQKCGISALGNALAQKIWGCGSPDEFDMKGGDDFIFGGGGNDRLFGGDGNDTIYGDDNAGNWTGADYLHGGNGNDTLLGGAGDDYISMNVGSDIAFGGKGKDTFAYFGHGDTIRDFQEGDRLKDADFDFGQVSAWKYVSTGKVAKVGIVHDNQEIWFDQEADAPHNLAEAIDYLM